MNPQRFGNWGVVAQFAFSILLLFFVGGLQKKRKY
jgi:hypothetical protein